MLIQRRSPRRYGYTFPYTDIRLIAYAISHTSKGMWIYTSRGHLPLQCSWLCTKVAKFQFVKNKAPSKRLILCHDTVPPKSSSQQILPMKGKEKHQLGVSRMGICVQRYIKYLKCHSFSGNFFREKNKKDRCGGTQERKKNARKQKKERKTTVNSVNPSCLSALSFWQSRPS